MSLERKGNQTAFWIGRVFRIYPIYILVFLISLMLISMGINHEQKHFFDNITKNIVAHLFFIQSYLPYEKFGITDLVRGSWTLFIELIWYVFFSALFFFSAQKKTQAISVFGSVLVLILCIASLLTGKRIPFGIICCFQLCIAGFVYSRYYENKISKTTFLLLTIASFLVIFFALFTGFHIQKNPNFSSRCVFTSWATGIFIFNGFFLGGNYIKGLISKALRFLGDISYSLYLIHGCILLALDQMIDFGAADVMVHLLISLLLSYLTFKLVEKPFIAIGKRLIGQTGSVDNASSSKA